MSLSFEAKNHLCQKNPASNCYFEKCPRKSYYLSSCDQRGMVLGKVKFLNSLHVFMVKDFSLSLATWLYGTARCLKTSWGTKDKSLALLHDHPFTKGGKNKTRACLTRVLQTFISVEEKLFILIPTTSVFLPISSVTNSQCGKVQIFLSFRFYVKSILDDLKVLKLPFLQFFIFCGSEFC